MKAILLALSLTTGAADNGAGFISPTCQPSGKQAEKLPTITPAPRINLQRPIRKEFNPAVYFQLQRTIRETMGKGK